MSNGEEQDMAVDSNATPFDPVSRGSERVVLRGVQVIVLNDILDEDDRVELQNQWSVREAWIAEAMAPGSFDAAVEAHAGRSGEQDNKPGQYRAVKKAAWLEKGPRVIEPSIA